MSSTAPGGMLPQLTPLLGSVARLVAAGSAPTDDRLRTLLLGIDVADEDGALRELRRWGRLLESFRQDPAREMAVAEALRLRGLPEAPVTLALAAVAGLHARDTAPLRATDEEAPVVVSAPWDVEMPPWAGAPPDRLPPPDQVARGGGQHAPEWAAAPASSSRPAFFEHPASMQSVLSPAAGHPRSRRGVLLRAAGGVLVLLVVVGLLALAAARRTTGAGVGVAGVPSPGNQLAAIDPAAVAATNAALRVALEPTATATLAPTATAIPATATPTATPTTAPAPTATRPPAAPPSPAPTIVAADNAPPTATPRPTPTAAPPPTPTVPTALRDAEQVVTGFYRAINNRDFPGAYALCAICGDYNSWVHGYDTTRSARLTILGSEADGSGRVTVQVQLESTETDNQTKRFSGVYYVERRDGALKIVGAKITQDS